MNIRSILSLFLVTTFLTLAACGNPEQAATPADALSDAAEQATEAAAEAADNAAAELESVAESVETAVEETADAIEEASTDAIELSTPAAATTAKKEWQYKEGSYFRRLTASQGTSSAPDKIEVAEIFWYGCPHCYDFDPVLEKWKASVAADVSFVRIPVVWNPTNQIHARLMYTAEALGKLDEMHAAIFATIHQDNVMLTKDDEIIALFKRFGVEEETFREAYGSFGVTSALKRAENLTRRYGIRSVPIIVVNGKYVTEGSDIKSFDDMIAVTNELVERERDTL